MVEIPIINRTYELYKHVALLNQHMDKRWRYSLGQSAEASILTMLELLILAKTAPKAAKPPFLLKASAQAEIATMKLRLLLELNVVNETKIFQAQSQLAEIGRMLGGWLRSLGA